MVNNNDWEELNKWEENRQNDEVEKYGVNISNMNINKRNSTMNKIVKRIKVY